MGGGIKQNVTVATVELRQSNIFETRKGNQSVGGGVDPGRTVLYCT